MAKKKPDQAKKEKEQEQEKVEPVAVKELDKELEPAAEPVEEPDSGVGSVDVENLEIPYLVLNVRLYSNAPPEAVYTSSEDHPSITGKDAKLVDKAVKYARRAARKTTSEDARRVRAANALKAQQEKQALKRLVCVSCGKPLPDNSPHCAYCPGNVVHEVDKLPSGTDNTSVVSVETVELTKEN